ncbi:MAG: APC family permease, partial [Ktedonobacterales bacterium]|nr:APC family permease [Ktedonobacterales bacterium]
AEVSVRFPEGGGVVTVAAHGLNPWAGAVGGMFILVDYFLTSALSSLSGLQYFTEIVPRIAPIVLPITVIVLALLGVLNWWGIKESAIVSAVIAVAAFLSDIAILILVLWKVPLRTILLVFREIFSGQHLTVPLVLTGFAGAFLAFSGLESISQLSPVMRAPRNKTVTAALALVVITVGVTSPLLTIFSTTLLNASTVDPNKFISQLGGAYGGDVLKILTAITASALLVFASNTAIIGAYHVFLALSRMRFFPEIVERTNQMRGTPHVSIILATGIPMGILIAVRGQIGILGDMYAFGLLGAFSLTCLALDVIRYRERRGMPLVGARAEADAHDAAHDRPGDERMPFGGERWRTWLRTQAHQRFVQGGIARLGAVRTRAAASWAPLARGLAPVRATLHGWWPNLKYYLGLVTT